MQGLEASAAEQFLYATLHGDSTLLGLVTDVYNTLAPQNTAYPFVVFQEMSGNDLMVVGAIRVWTGMQFMVKVVGQTADYGDIKAATARVDVLLQRGSGAQTDGTVWSCVREQTIRLADTGPGGQAYRSSGGIYRLLAS